MNKQIERRKNKMKETLSWALVIALFIITTLSLIGLILIQFVS